MQQDANRTVIWGALCSLLLLGLLMPMQAQAAREISPKRECSICHVMWLNEFQKEETETLIPYEPRPVVATGKQDVVSTERMCFSCHDGFVRDSRFAWAKREHFHPVGIVPPADITIPKKDGKEIFPLNDEGKIYCGTCHSAHGVDWNEEYSPLFLRVKNNDSSLCLACHVDRSTGPKEGNHPVYKPIGEIPDTLLDAGSKFGKKGDVICQSCHRIHGAGDNKLLVVKNDRSQLCGTCHADRYVDSRAAAAQHGTHPVNILPETVEIPESLGEQGSKLGAGGEIICQTCHRPHFAQNKGGILVTDNTGSQLCRTCHTRQKSVDGTRHDITQKAGGEEVGACASCHRPHNGEGPKMWARELAPGEEPMAALCLSCHREGGVAEKRQVGMHSHPVGRAMAALPHPGKLPAYSKFGLKQSVEEGGRVTCASCHDPHQWDPLDHANKGKAEIAGDGNTRFLRQRNTPDGALCQTCHREKFDIAGSPHDRGEAPLKEASEIDKQGSLCMACHQVHNGQGPRMWSFKPAQGVDPVSSLCLSCHRDGGAAEHKTIGKFTHPVDAPISALGIRATLDGWVTEIKNLFDTPLKTLPLFNGAGRKVIDGNVTCASCHDPHRHNPAGDGSGRFLRLPNDRKATLCRNCHLDKGQVALSKHNLAISAPEERNIQDVPAKDGSPCSNCHLPHNGSGPRMWAGFFGPGEDAVSELCLGCHQEGGVAEQRQVGLHSHPLQVDPKNVGVDTQLPLFRSDGTRDLTDGRLSCPTCHNPHQWDPNEPRSEAGAQAKVEGNAANSFLRLPAAGGAQLCVDCHEDKQWVRGTDHDLAVTAPHDVNGGGQSVDASGVCGQCHMVHNAQEDNRLWARTPGAGQDIMESMCRSCHAEQQVAQNKLPLMPRHPGEVKAVSIRGWPRPGQVRAHFPVFDAQGNEVNTGVITCPTCHNPHQWAPGAEREGAGRNLEGTVRSSFLRNKSDFSLCTNCHGMDALFRYKYFHGKGSRVPHKLYR